MAIEPEALFKYATNYARRSEEKGLGTQYPSFREAAKRFNATHEDIEDACADWDQSKGYMQPAVGFTTGAGYGSYASKGEHLIEAYI